MNRFYLVPQAVISKGAMPADENKPPTTLALPTKTLSPVSRLETELQQLNVNNRLSDDARWRGYEQIFQSFFQNNRQQPVTSAVTGEQYAPEGLRTHAMMESLLSSLPKRDVSKAQTLLQLLENHPPQGGVSFDSKGQVIIGNQTLEGSNFIDLIHYSVRQRLKPPKITPIGWNAFFALLREANIPQNILAPFISTLNGRRSTTTAQAVALKPYNTGTVWRTQQRKRKRILADHDTRSLIRDRSPISPITRGLKVPPRQLILPVSPIVWDTT